MVVIVDTAVWIDYLEGADIPIIDQCLNEGRLLLPPLVLAELMSGKPKPGHEKYFVQLLETLPLHSCPRSHWMAVGRLRQKLASKGLNVSVPDAHVAQCAIDLDGELFSHDKIFEKMLSLCTLRLSPRT